jgi:hypothetical protein
VIAMAARKTKSTSEPRRTVPAPPAADGAAATIEAAILHRVTDLVTGACGVSIRQCPICGWRIPADMSLELHGMGSFGVHRVQVRFNCPQCHNHGFTVIYTP